jgi:adenylosuccinate lyase
MQQNLAITNGLYFSQSILLELTRRGMDRKEAYELVQKAATATWQGKDDFLTELERIPEIVNVIPKSDLAGFCSLEQHFRYIDRTFRQLKLGKNS